MSNTRPTQPAQPSDPNPNSNLRFIQQALANTLEPSVPPIERVDLLAAIAVVLLEKAKPSDEVESTFLEHIMLAQYGTSAEWDEHRNCVARLHMATAEIALQKLADMEQADNPESTAATATTTTDDFEFPEELNTL